MPVSPLSTEHPKFVFLSRDLATSIDASDNEILKLTRALVRGQEEAWTSFYKNYHRRLRCYLFSCWKGEPSIIDDLLQETFLRAVKYMRPFHEERTLWSWLTVLARSAVADHGRKRSRFRRFLDTFRPERSSCIPADEDLKSALQKISREHRQLLEWKYDEGRSVAGIATSLGITEKAAESRLTRARAALKKYYCSSS